MDDQGLDTLLELNGIQYGIQGDFWVKFEVQQSGITAIIAALSVITSLILRLS